MSAKTARSALSHRSKLLRRERLTLLGAAEEGPVVLEAEVDVDELRAREELHDHAGSNDRGDTELHERAPVGGEDGSEPVERVGRVRRHDTVQGHLRAHQEDEQRRGRPCDLGVEGDLSQRVSAVRTSVLAGRMQLTFRSGAVTSGKMLMNGLTSSRNRTAEHEYGLPHATARWSRDRAADPRPGTPTPLSQDDRLTAHDAEDLVDEYRRREGVACMRETKITSCKCMGSV